MGFADDFESFRGPTSVADDFESFRTLQTSSPEAAAATSNVADDKPWYDDASEIARQTYWSTYHGIPLTLLKAARGIVTASGDDLSGNTTAQLSNAIDFFDNPGVQQLTAPDLEGRGTIASTFIKGASNIGPSLAGMGAAAINPLLGGAAVLAAFGGSQYDDTYQRAIKSGLSENKAHEAAVMAGLIEGGGETIGDLVGARAIKGTGGLLAELVGAGGAKGAIKAATDTRLVVPFLKSQAENLAVQTATEFGQGAGEAAVESGYGIRDEQGNLPDWMAQGSEGAQAAVGMSILLAPFGVPGAVKVRNQNRATAKALADPNVGIEQRAAAIKRVYAELSKESPAVAKQWASHAAQQLVTGQAIGLETEFESAAGQAEAILSATTPDEVVQEAAQPAAPEPTVANITGASSIDEALSNLPSIEDIEGLLTSPIPQWSSGIGNAQVPTQAVVAGPTYDAAAVMPAPQQSTADTQPVAIESPLVPVVPDTPAVMQPQQQDEQPTAPAPRQAPPEAINRPMASGDGKAKRVIPLTLDGATRTANKLNNMGYPSRVIPHGEVANRYRVVAIDSPDIDNQAHATATSPHNDLREPTPAQQEAGNYAKGHVTIDGMDISIENPQGSVRKGVSNGTAWQSTMQHHYGYIKGTVGRDKDHIDVFIKPGTQASPQVFVIDQIDPETEKFDEHKVVLGAASEDEAVAIYRANYDKNWRGLGAVNAMSAQAFKDWLASGNTKKPISYVAPKKVRQPGGKPKGSGELLQAIINAGGISTKIKNDVGGDSGVRHRPGLFTKAGYEDMELLAERLISEGFHEHLPTNTPIGLMREMENLIARALRGERILSENAAIDEENKQERAVVRGEAKQAGIKTVGRKYEDVMNDVLRFRELQHTREVEALDEQARKDYDSLVGEARALLIRDVDDIIKEVPDNFSPRQAYDMVADRIISLIEQRLTEINGEFHLLADAQLRENNERQIYEPETDDADGPTEQVGATGGGTIGDRPDAGALLSTYDRNDLARQQARAKDETVAAKEVADREREVFALTPPKTLEKVVGNTQQGGLFTPNGRPAADATGRPPDKPVADQPTAAASTEAVVVFADRLRVATAGKTVTVNAKVAGADMVTPLANQDAGEVVSMLRKDINALEALRICMRG